MTLASALQSLWTAGLALGALAACAKGSLVLLFGGESMENYVKDMRQRQRETLNNFLLLGLAAGLAFTAYYFS